MEGLPGGEGRGGSIVAVDVDVLVGVVPLADQAVGPGGDPPDIQPRGGQHQVGTRGVQVHVVGAHRVPRLIELAGHPGGGTSAWRDMTQAAGSVKVCPPPGIIHMLQVAMLLLRPFSTSVDRVKPGDSWAEQANLAQKPAICWVAFVKPVPALGPGHGAGLGPVVGAGGALPAVEHRVREVVDGVKAKGGGGLLGHAAVAEAHRAEVLAVRGIIQQPVLLADGRTLDDDPPAGGPDLQLAQVGVADGDVVAVTQPEVLGVGAGAGAVDGAAAGYPVAGPARGAAVGVAAA